MYNNIIYMFNCQIGKFNKEEDQNTINKIKNWSLQYFENDLKKRPSLHKYISKLPTNIIKEIDKIRYSKEITNNICKQYKKCKIIPLNSIDEIYISHVNYDNGGDQGLFDKHYDGNLRFINNATTIRALIYLSSNGDLKVVFGDCGKSKNFKSFEYGLLDFHKEYHWVEGSYNPNEKVPRIIIKCNYMICEDCSYIYQELYKYMNLFIFYVVKLSMEYSKSPKTSFQKFVGFFCNFFRIINIYSPFLSFIFVFVVIILILIIMFLLLKFTNEKLIFSLLKKK